MAAILSGKKLRMSDITKSNDYDEVRIFFPGIMDAMLDEYIKNPFPFTFAYENNENAIRRLLQFVYEYFFEKFRRGAITNFVVCFCEDGDKLSQWRGYADNGKGCSIGFSETELRHYVEKYSDFMTIEKVQYITNEEINNLIILKAKNILNELKDLAKWTIEKFKYEYKKTEKYMTFSIIQMFNIVFMKSLKYKNKAYEEENEWRIFFRYPIEKKTRLIYGEEEVNTLSDEMVKMLRNKIDFNITSNDIVPFYPIELFGVSEKPIKEVIMGSQNKILIDDFQLFCGKYGYDDVKFKVSKISYKGE